MDRKLLRETVFKFVVDLMERKSRQIELQTGRKVNFGSQKHIADLERRISDFSHWRDKEKKGSEARANYSRIVNRLKRELASAKKILEKAEE